MRRVVNTLLFTVLLVAGNAIISSATKIEFFPNECRLTIQDAGAAIVQVYDTRVLFAKANYVTHQEWELPERCKVGSGSVYFDANYVNIYLFTSWEYDHADRLEMHAGEMQERGTGNISRRTRAASPNRSSSAGEVEFFPDECRLAIKNVDFMDLSVSGRKMYTVSKNMRHRWSELPDWCNPGDGDVLIDAKSVNIYLSRGWEYGNDHGLKMRAGELRERGTGYIIRPIPRSPSPRGRRSPSFGGNCSQSGGGRTTIQCNVNIGNRLSGDARIERGRLTVNGRPVDVQSFNRGNKVSGHSSISGGEFDLPRGSTFNGMEI